MYCGSFGRVVTFSKMQEPRIVATLPVIVLVTLCSLTIGPESVNAFDRLFSGQISYDIGNGPADVTLSDINGDGAKDLLATNFADHSVSILLNEGNGTFVYDTTLTTGSNPWGICSRDFDGDGIKDIVVGLFTGDGLQVFRGSADGHFEAYENCLINNKNVFIESSDLDADGDYDIIACQNDYNRICILKNDGFGHFGSPTYYVLASKPWACAVADVDRDGDLDLLANNEGTNTFSVLKNKGDGTFLSPIPFGVGSNPVFVASGDLNEDGNADAVTANYLGNSVGVRLGYGNGSFATSNEYMVGQAPRSVACVDANGDGHLDLVAANRGDHTLSILYGQGDGTFLDQNVIPVGRGPVIVLGGNVDQDQEIELAYVSETDGAVGVLDNLGDGQFMPSFLDLTDFGSPFEILVGHFDADTLTDFAVSLPAVGVCVLEGSNTGGFDTPVLVSSVYNSYAIAAADFDNDGKDEIISAPYESALQEIDCDSAGSYWTARTFGGGELRYSALASDLNHDGWVDLATASTSESAVITYSNVAGNFVSSGVYGVGGGGRFLSAADFDKNAANDMVQANAGHPTFSVLRNLDNGSFATAETYFVDGGEVIGVATCDLDKDSWMDLVVVTSLSKLWIYLSNTDGTFRKDVNYALPQGAVAVYSADCNGDNWPDILVMGSRSVTCFSNERNGGFGTGICYIIGSDQSRLCAADLDGDEDLDLALTDLGLKRVWLLSNVTQAPSCCSGTTGNVNKSTFETPDLSDLSLLISYLTVTPRPALPCNEEANLNNSAGGAPPHVDLSDLSLLIAYLTQTPRPTLPSCP